MDLNLVNMFSASRIIRLMIVILGGIVIWRVWDYVYQPPTLVQSNQVLSVEPNQILPSIEKQVDITNCLFYIR